MQRLMMQELDPLPLRLGQVVRAKPAEAKPALTSAECARAQWVDAYETTERDMAARPQRFYSERSAADPLGQRVRRREAGELGAGNMTDDEASEIMVRNLRRNEHEESFLRVLRIDNLYALYLADLQAREREEYENTLLTRIKSRAAHAQQVDRAMRDVVSVGVDMGRPGGDSSAMAVRRGGELHSYVDRYIEMLGQNRTQLVLEGQPIDDKTPVHVVGYAGHWSVRGLRADGMCEVRQVKLRRFGSPVVDEMVALVRVEQLRLGGPPAKRHVLMVEGSAVDVGPGTTTCVTVRGDPEQRVWRVLKVQGSLATLECDHPSREARMAHVAELRHEIPF